MFRKGCLSQESCQFLRDAKLVYPVGSVMDRVLGYDDVIT